MLASQYLNGKLHGYAVKQMAYKKLMEKHQGEITIIAKIKVMNAMPKLTFQNDFQLLGLAHTLVTGLE